MKHHPFLKGMAVCLSTLLAGLFVFFYATSRGLHRKYKIDYTIPAINNWPSVGNLQVGIGVRQITPLMEYYDTWTDINGNGAYEPDIDTYEDVNGNDTFDLVWMAGFDSNRPAQGVNDPLWSRAIAFRNNGLTIVLVSIDSIGLTYDQYISIRQMVKKIRSDIDHITFAATHTHNAPDTIGLWSYRLLLNSRFDEEYIKFLQQCTCDAVLEAVENLVPTDTIIANAYVPKENFSRDSRQPIMVDHQLPVAWFRKKINGQSIGTLASWGMHPEAFGSENTFISSDFVHYYRQAMENGLAGTNGFAGFGGRSVFFTGPVGGLMTQLGLEITDRFGQQQSHDGRDKAQAQGENLAILASQALRSSTAKKMEDQHVALSAKTFYSPVGWPMKILVALGTVHPGLYGNIFATKVRSEINAIRVGEIELLTTPGEIFPEIVDGGIETPDGADIPIPPVEVPPLRHCMTGWLNLNINLGMDEVGYIVPISQWDRKPPYTYENKKAPYGEVYIGTPKASRIIYQTSIELLDHLHTTLRNAPEKTALPRPMPDSH